jgi:hypothetical protein
MLQALSHLGKKSGVPRQVAQSPIDYYTVKIHTEHKERTVQAG